MRSKLFVPGIRPELFAKACAGEADAVSFDLEDAVPPARKAEARRAVAAFLSAQPRPAQGKDVVVRVNPVGTAEFEDDLATLLPLPVDLLNLPRVESAETVHAAVAAIERHASAQGHATPLRLLVNIETPRGLRRAAGIAGAHPRIAGLQLGLGDLFEPHGIRRNEQAHVRMAMFQVAMAAAEAGVFACDGAHPDYTDDAGFVQEARMSRALGFAGKSCIHPRQVSWANAAFAPTAEELDWARRVIDAAAVADAQGKTVFSVDGRMVDPPYLRRAQRLLADAGERA
ncbi:CoA ester lyase [Luteimonas aestuarii]|uniref:CoA ester lyase n=1 Tax=Luteimonas aestuarii TaxID=453837 RepID=A0A4R5TKJ0_9GAMM|nr:CoA ester lyase [Luteimonas aestuarii]TDK23077.1 CoA ester lyase [Luteimonas aestuarii]